jgi:hypothetical protein
MQYAGCSWQKALGSLQWAALLILFVAFTTDWKDAADNYF